jgi:hypothetical protein
MDIKISSLEDVKKLLAGEHESQQKVNVGYEGESKIENTPRKIGDKWFDEDGNEWEQREGYKIKLGKKWQQELHEYLNSFPNCQKENCTCTLPKKLDEKMRRIHGMCFDCAISFEHKLRLEGKWEEYERKKIRENAIAWLRDAEKDKNVIVDELSRLEFTNDFGEIEKWDTRVNKEELLKKIESEFEQFRKDFIDQIEEKIGYSDETD